MLVTICLDNRNEVFEYDLEMGIDTLKAQCWSVFQFENDPSSVVFVDYCGNIVLDGDLVRLKTLETIQLYCILEPSIFCICTKRISMYPLIQPCFKFYDSDYYICQHCSKSIDSELISKTSLSLKRFVCSGDIFLGTNEENSPKCAAPVELYFRKAALIAAIDDQDIEISTSKVYNYEIDSERKKFLDRLESGYQTVLAHENDTEQGIARSLVDYVKISSYCNSIKQSNDSMGWDVIFLEGLLQWFKNDFFKWCNAPRCSHASCSSIEEATKFIRVDPPLENEKSQGWASRVEIFQCQSCSNVTRFPRFNKASHLLTTRQGRCGEFANSFGLLCRALGFDTRYVLDFTDHVWVEVYLPSEKRFVCLDPCEKKLDCPLMYEAGWGKKLTYILSFSRYGVVDATSRYTRHYEEVVERRSMLGEKFAQDAVRQKDESIWNSFKQSMEYRYLFEEEEKPEMFYNALEVGAMAFESFNLGERSLSILDQRRYQLTKEIEGLKFLSPEIRKLKELEGRITGDYLWKFHRGELGSS